MGIQQIFPTMTKLIHVHQVLNELAVQKKDYLVKQDLSNLEEIVRQENKMVHQLQVLDGIRAKQVKELLATQEVPQQEETISRVMELLGETEKEQLTSQYHQLLKLVEELKLKNEQNQSLIEDAMQFVHVSLDVLSPVAEDYQYTDSQKDVLPEPGRSLFDSKA